jgi:hypothetical protein
MLWSLTKTKVRTKGGTWQFNPRLQTRIRKNLKVVSLGFREPIEALPLDDQCYTTLGNMYFKFSNKNILNGLH